MKKTRLREEELEKEEIPTIKWNTDLSMKLDPKLQQKINQYVIEDFNVKKDNEKIQISEQLLKSGIKILESQLEEIKIFQVEDDLENEEDEEDEEDEKEKKEEK